MFDGKMKALTFSYDDGVTQDIRLIELLNKYGMKATFNLNSDLLGMTGSLVRDGVCVSHNKNRPEDIKHIYDGHEIAVHTLTHPNLLHISDDSEVIRQVEQDRINLSELCGYEVTGMAYPYGIDCYDDRILDIIRRNTRVQYARTAVSTHEFVLPSDCLEYHPSVYHHKEMDKMFELGEKFLKLEADKPQLFCVWGHAYEFDIFNDWAIFEEFLQMMSKRTDICYCTNREALLSR